MFSFATLKNINRGPTAKSDASPHVDYTRFDVGLA